MMSNGGSNRKNEKSHKCHHGEYVLYLKYNIILVKVITLALRRSPLVFILRTILKYLNAQTVADKWYINLSRSHLSILLRRQNDSPDLPQCMSNPTYFKIV